MLISGFEQTNLVTAIHQGPLETPIWSSFLRQLREQSAADIAMLILRRGDGEALQLSKSKAGGGNSEQYDLCNRAGFSTNDPVPFAALRPERVYTLQEFVSHSSAGQSAGGNSCIIPPEYRHARIIRIPEPSGYSAWLITLRQRHDFAGADSARLTAAAPHFAIALRSFAAIERERLRMQISNQATESLNFGWITLDQDGFILDSDQQAERLLTDAQAVRRSAQGKFQPMSRDAQGQLARMLGNAAAGKPIAASAVHLGEEPWLDMLITPPRPSMVNDSKNVALIAYIHGDTQPRRERVEQISGLFGLTVQEARLALALSRGRSIAESAADLNISVHTARLYSKRIYAKTGTRGQADLVRLILSSIMAL